MYIDWIIFSIEQITFVVYLIHHKESLVNTKITICNAFLNQITTFDHLQTDSKTAEKKQPSKLITFVRSSITSVPIAKKVFSGFFPLHFIFCLVMNFQSNTLSIYFT